MSGRTFSDPEVRKLLGERFVFIELNVDREKETAAWFGGAAIPDTLIFSIEGKILDRLVGFEGPDAFVRRLRNQIKKE